MQTLAEQSAREAAFGLLASTVAEFEAAARPAYGAPLKVALQRRSNGWFDETKLGFSRFKGFLEAARNAGIVDFEPTPGGDLRVFTRQPDIGTTKAPAPPARRISFIRRDMWRAFFVWAPPLQRWYDLDEQRAVMVRGEAGLLNHLAGRPRDRVIQIEPVSMETQMSWMREFAETAGESREVLHQALTADRPFATFTHSVNQAGLTHEWREARQQRVVDVMRSWMTEHGVEIPLFTEPRSDERPVKLASRHSDGDVRQALHAAIDRMPLSEMLRLSIPLEYLLP